MTQTESPPTTRRRRALGRDFRLLLTASTISNVGDGIDATALPLLAAALTQDPRLFAGVALASKLPWLLFALQAGALADRVDRRRLMLRVNLVRTMLLALLGAAVVTDMASIWLLYAVSFGLGTSEVLFDTSAQAFLPRLVEREQLERANGLQFGLETVANQFVGPPLGGFLFTVAAALPILLDAGTFLVAAGMLALITASAGRVAVRPGTPDPRDAGLTSEPAAEVGDAEDAQDAQDAEGTTTPTSVRREIAEGMAWLRRHPVLRSFAILLGLMNGSFMMFSAVLLLFVQEELGLDEIEFGLLLTAMAVGSVVGSLTARRVVERLGRGTTVWLTLLAAVALPALHAAPNVWVVASASALFGLAGVLWNIVTVSLRQTIIPDHLLGRVNAVYRFLGWGSMPIGALLGGELAARFGLRAPFFAGSLIMVVGVAVLGRHISVAAIERARADAVR